MAGPYLCGLHEIMLFCFPGDAKEHEQSLIPCSPRDGHYPPRPSIQVAMATVDSGT